MSLQRRIKSDVRVQQSELKSQLGSFKPTFTAHYEDMLVAHMRDLDSKLMPLAKTEFLKLDMLWQILLSYHADLIGQREWLVKISI